MIKQQMLPQIRPSVKKRDVYSEGKKKDSGSLLATEICGLAHSKEERTSRKRTIPHS